jgi:hypothetical protein
MATAQLGGDAGGRAAARCAFFSLGVPIVWTPPHRARFEREEGPEESEPSNLLPSFAVSTISRPLSMLGETGEESEPCDFDGVHLRQE